LTKLGAEIESLLVNWSSKYTNSKLKTKMKIAVNFRADNWVWQELFCMKLKVGRRLWVQLKEIERTWTHKKHEWGFNSQNHQT